MPLAPFWPQGWPKRRKYEYRCTHNLNHHYLQFATGGFWASRRKLLRESLQSWIQRHLRFWSNSVLDEEFLLQAASKWHLETNPACMALSTYCDKDSGDIVDVFPILLYSFPLPLSYLPGLFSPFRLWLSFCYLPPSFACAPLSVHLLAFVLSPTPKTFAQYSCMKKNANQSKVGDIRKPFPDQPSAF